MSFIYHILGEMLPYMLTALFIFSIVRLIIHRKAGRSCSSLNWRHEIGFLLFVLFVVGLASKTIIPNFYWHEGQLGIMGYGNDYLLAVNLTPFKKIVEIQHMIKYGIWSYFIVEVLGNIGMFIPIGFALPLLWRRFEKLWVTIIICFAISFFIELVQLMIPLRATDVDDLIMNTLGGIIGCLLYLLIRRLSKGRTDKWKHNTL